MKKIFLKIIKNEIVQITGLAFAAYGIIMTMGVMLFIAAFPSDPELEQQLKQVEQIEQVQASKVFESVEEIQTDCSYIDMDGAKVINACED